MISVIIPSYNRKETILRSINSILRQTYQDFEIIVVDDCSTDGTKEFLEQEKNEKVRVVSLDKNRGANYARNYGISLAEGKYIAFQDSDDEWLPNKLEVQLSHMNNYDVSSCRLLLKTDEEDKGKIIPDFDSNIVNVAYNDLLPRNLISTQTIFGKREVFEDINFDEQLPRFQDWDLMLRVCQKYKVFFDANYYTNQYYQKDSITRNPYKAIESINMIRKKYIGCFDNEELDNMYYFQLSKAFLDISIIRSWNYFLIAKKIRKNRTVYKNYKKQFLKKCLTKITKKL